MARTLFAVIAVVSFAVSLSAATLTVTTGNDGPIGTVGGCSLREAVNAINSQRNGDGCTNSSNEGYGVNDSIRFSDSITTFSLRALNPLPGASQTSLFVNRPMSIRGRGRTRTILDGGGQAHTLIENSSTLSLSLIQLRNAGRALNNVERATANIALAQFSGHSGRAIVNRGSMEITRSFVTNNRGGGIFNGSGIRVTGLGGGSLDALLLDRCADCWPPGGGGGEPPPRDEATIAAMTVTRTEILNNGPVDCAGIANGGGVVRGQPGGIGDVGGNPLVTEKIEGALVVRRSRIAGNNGGGVCNQSGLMITESEISTNRAVRGAGISIRGLSLADFPIVIAKPVTIVTNSTISLNRASVAGGGVFAQARSGELRMQYVTLARNTADGVGPRDAGGIAAESPMEAAVSTTILSGNRAEVSAPDCANVTLRGNFNFWATVNQGTCTLSGNNNVTTGNASLAPLAANGDDGGLRSHLPPANSAVVDVIPTGNPLCGGFDQRRRARPRPGNIESRNGCDIGAIERP